MNYTDTRNAIATALSSIDGLNVDTYPPGSVNVPHGFIAGLTGAQADFDGGDRATFEVLILLSVADDASAWLDIDAYLEHGGTKCVVDALANELGGAFQGATFSTTPGDANDIPYNGLRFQVEVVG